MIHVALASGFLAVAAGARASAATGCDAFHAALARTFVATAPAPLKVSATVRPASDASSCEEPAPADYLEEGAWRIELPLAIAVTVSVGPLSTRWELSEDGALLILPRRDGGWSSRTELYAAGLALGSSTRRRGIGRSADNLAALRDRREFAGLDALLVRSLARPGAHRADALALVRELDFEHLSGDAWIALRRLRATRRLRRVELARLGWLFRGADAAIDAEATIFTAEEDGPPPRVFVAGEEHTGWTRTGDRHELRVPRRGLAAVRVEFADAGHQAFVAALGRGVRIRLRSTWGPMADGPPGPRCGLVRDARSAGCGQEEVTAPIGTVFDLEATCGGMPAASGTALDFGISLVASLPGLYVRGRDRELRLDGAATACRRRPAWPDRARAR